MISIALLLQLSGKEPQQLVTNILRIPQANLYASDGKRQTSASQTTSPHPSLLQKSSLSRIF